MNFKPMSKQELKNILSDGNYSFEVISAIEKQSKAGNTMIALNLKVGGEHSHTVFINDWLIKPHDHEDAEQAKNKIWKIRSFCYSIGLQDKYESGSLTDVECVGKKGMAKIKIRNDQNGDPVNAIAYYLEQTSLTAFSALASKANEKVDIAMKTHKDKNQFLYDDMPF
jgi:hypothetical protein